MAEDIKERYPNMPTNNWLALRKKFRNTIPAKASSSYLSSALQITEDSAKNNILPSLRITGIVDEEGKPTERAVKWRDDAQYSQVCKEIMEDVYPQELLDLASDENFDRSSVQSWFANRLRVGENASRKFASFFVTLNQADLSKETETPERNKNKPKVERKPKVFVSKQNEEKPEPIINSHQEVEKDRTTNRFQPKLHIDVQIHISPDSSAEQIDAIFASMAKHLKDFS